MLVPWDLRNLRPAASGDQDILGSEALTIDLDLVRPGQTRMAFVQGHATADQQVTVDPVEAVDFAIFVGDQRRPIKVRLAQGPAKAAGLLEVFGKVRTVHQQFFWHTTNVDARPAQIAAFRHGHLRTKTCGKACRSNTTGTGANYIKIKIVGHFTLLGRMSGYPLASKKPESHPKVAFLRLNRQR